MPFDHLLSKPISDWLCDKYTIEVTGNPAFRKELSDTTQIVISLRISLCSISGVRGQPPPSQLPSAGRQLANGEADGLPEAMLAFTKSLLCESPKWTAVLTHFSDQYFSSGFLYCAEGFRKLLCKKHSGKKNAVAFQKKAPLQFYTLYGIIYLI